MKANVKFYPSIFDACDDKDSRSCVIYGDSRTDVMESVYALSEKYVVSNVYITDGNKKDEVKA